MSSPRTSYIADGSKKEAIHGDSFFSTVTNRTYKPSSVPTAEAVGGNHLSGTTVTCRLMRPYPREERAILASAGQTPPPIRSCSGWGLPSRLIAQPLVRSYRTFSALPWTSLTAASRRFLFCGTFLKVTLTGRYPAPCPLELGLSSGAAFAAGTRGYPVRLVPGKIILS